MYLNNCLQVEGDDPPFNGVGRMSAKATFQASLATLTRERARVEAALREEKKLLKVGYVYCQIDTKVLPRYTLVSQGSVNRCVNTKIYNTHLNQICVETLEHKVL